jgi:RHS repeat-associated protein
VGEDHATHAAHPRLELETIGPGPALDYVPNPLNQYASIGGVTRTPRCERQPHRDGTRTLGWDAESQLVSASVAGTAATYAYDPFGRRVRKTVDGSDTWFLWSGDRLLEERDDTGALAVRYTYGVGYAPVQVRIADGGSGEDVYDVHTDHLDTPRRLTDAAGAEVWVAEMAAFGEAFVEEDPDGDLAEVAFHVRFPGQYFDAETGLHYNRFRYYSAELGRYISPDPIGQLFDNASPSMALAFSIGEGFEVEPTPTNHPYSYVDNDPISWIDPLGLAKGKNKGGKGRRYENLNKKKGSENRHKVGARERNVGHPKGEEHSRLPKGRGGRGMNPKLGAFGVVLDILGILLEAIPCPPPRVDPCTRAVTYSPGCEPPFNPETDT